MEDELLSIVEDGEKIYNIRHRCFHFAKDVITFIKNTSYDRMYFSMFEQLLRSATSIGANVVEGSAGSTKRDFSHFYTIALKSANETKYWLCLIRDTLSTDTARLAELLKEADELSKIIAAIILSAKQTK